MYRIPYYLTGHTSKGFINLLNEDHLHNIEQIVMVKHDSRYLKTSVLQALLQASSNSNSKPEVILSADGAAYLEGVILRDKALAILTDTLLADISLPRLQKQIVELDLGETLHVHQSKARQEKKHLAFDLCTQAHQAFANGLAIHDDLEAIYARTMDFEQADQLAVKTARQLLANVQEQAEDAVISKRLFGTNTPDGVVNIVPELLSRATRIHYIKGRAGTGKSTLMRHIANACIEKGLNIELYQCSFDPKSVDMVFVPELQYVIFDATEPHVFNPIPGKTGQEIIDTYEIFVAPGTDERFADHIAETNARYKACMKAGIDYLRQVGNIYDFLEAPYREAQHTSEVANKVSGIAADILKSKAKKE